MTRTVHLNCCRNSQRGVNANVRVSVRVRGETVRVEWVGVRASQQRVRVRVQCGHTMCACDLHSGQSFTGHLSFCNIHFSLMMQPSS